ncbi:hypothetical protein FI667_g4914, partial [Globisporangium splendens]
MAVKKDAMLVQNLKLLGFPAADSHYATSASASSSHATSVPPLHAHMFDRPNEKLLFHVLHFLLVHLEPNAAQVGVLFCLCKRDAHDYSVYSGGDWADDATCAREAWPVADRIQSGVAHQHGLRTKVRAFHVVCIDIVLSVHMSDVVQSDVVRIKSRRSLVAALNAGAQNSVDA